MKRIIAHWTGGNTKPNSTDLEHYHYVVDGNGTVLTGKYKPEDNENCNDSKYAQHTGGGNTGSIGIALCGMYVPNGTPVQKTQYPVTKVQCERFFKLIAELSQKYNIPITPQTVMTHYEFGKKNPKTSSYGKIDITYLPPYPSLYKEEVGDFIRSKARWYLKNL